MAAGSRPVRLKYHQVTFDLLNAKPVSSDAAVRLIRDWQRTSSLALPIAMEEWYSLEVAELMLSNLGHPYKAVPLQSILRAIQAMGVAHSSGEYIKIIDLDDRWPLEYYSIRIDGTADPRVSSRDYQLDEGLFSAFVFRWVWDGVNGNDRTEESLGGNCWSRKDCCGPNDLECLRRHFREGLHETWRAVGMHNALQPQGPLIDVYQRLAPNQAKQASKPPLPDRHDYYFFCQGKRVFIRCNGQPANAVVPALWHLGADSREQLADLLELIWPCGTLSKTLKAWDKETQLLLRRIRYKLGKKQSPDS